MSEKTLEKIAEYTAIPEKEWRWLGVAGHFISSARCQFSLHTEVGNYIISTIGEMIVDGEPMDVGRGKYETMIFETCFRCTAPGCNCDYPLHTGQQLNTKHCNTRAEAQEQHLAECRRVANGGTP
jgi:hypothetical protein